MRFGNRVVVGVVLMSFSACPKGGGDDAGVDAGTEWQRYCAAAAAAYCQEEVRCLDTDSSALSACVRANSVACEAGVPSAIKRRTAPFPADAGSACLTKIAGTDCDSLYGNYRYYCLETLFEGIGKPPGASCANFSECSTHCEFHSSSDVCGTCSDSTTSPPCGGSCDAGSFCNQGTAACELLRADGAECFNANQCASAACRLYSRKCGLSAEGGDCGGEQDCAPTHYCQGWKPEPTTSGQCAPRVAAGGACAVQEWDSAGGCALGTWCLDGHCIAPDAGSRVEGAACATQAQCAPEAMCDGLEERHQFGHCLSTTLDGPCTEGGWCSPGTRCINAGDGGVCMARAGLDAPCTFDLDGRFADNCFDGLICGAFGADAPRCVPFRELTQGCTTHQQCLSLNCAQSKCGSPAPAGASCGGGAGCASGQCDDFDYFTMSGTCHAVCD